MNVLVLGGTGLIGKNLEKYVEKESATECEWHFVGSKDADLTVYEDVSKLFDRVKSTWLHT